MAHGQSQTAELQQIRRGSEPEIEVNAVLNPIDDRTIERPIPPAQARDAEVDRLNANPATDSAVLGAPRTIASDAVRELDGSSALKKGRCAVELCTNVIFCDA